MPTFLAPIDLNRNELRSAVIHPLATAPTSASEGQVYYNTTSNKLFMCTVASETTPTWIDVSDSLTLDGQPGSYYLNRANHTGTQTASTISDLATKPLSFFAPPTANIDIGSYHILTSQNNPTSTSLVNRNYVDNLVNGKKWKDSVRVATAGNITLSGIQTIDGVAGATDMRVLVRAQTTTALNGIYTMSSGSWARSSDADTWLELVSATVKVEEGTTYADTEWTCNVNQGGTLNSTPVTWVDTGSGGLSAGSGITIASNTVSVQLEDETMNFVGSEVGVKLKPNAGLVTDALNGIGVKTNRNLGTTLDATGTLKIARYHETAGYRSGLHYEVSGEAGLQIKLNSTALSLDDDGLSFVTAYIHQKLVTTITGNGSQTIFSVPASNPGNSTYHVCQCLDMVTNQIVYPDFVKIDATNYNVVFGIAPANGKQYRIIIF